MGMQRSTQILGGAEKKVADRGDDGDRAKIQEIFGCQVEYMPAWIVNWAQNAQFEPWEDVQKVVTELWAIGVAVTITAIWRLNVDRVHEDGDRVTSLQEALSKWGSMVREAYERYKLRMYPVTQSSYSRIQVAEVIRNRWAADEGRLEDAGVGGPLRIGFFDGGSRGNPGPGGSGSVVVQRNGPSEEWRPMWAAATALGQANTTNNVAEFVGLHRLLLQAATQGWRNIHIVGDSAMILRLMKNRKTPKARKLRHWYFQSARLADICGVSSWEHHYRRSNKMADWLANQAMDRKQSIMEVFGSDGHTRRLYAGIEERLAGDVRQWMESSP
jgi:ribonuclease HI